MSVMDDETFAKLVRENMQSIYRLALGIVHNREDAEDVAAQSVLKAYEKIHTLKKQESFRAWLMQITVNEARQVYSHKKRSLPVENVEEYMPEFRDEYHELWDMVNKLEPAYREATILYFYENLPVKEIAKILHIPEGTVKSRLHRAKKILREEICD